MDRGAWWVAVCGVTESDMTEYGKETKTEKELLKFLND